MDAKLEQLVNEIVEKKTLSLDGVEAVAALRQKIADYERAERSAAERAAEVAANEMARSRDAYQTEARTAQAELAKYRAREQQIAVTEALTKAQEAALQKVFALVEIIFRNTSVRTRMQGSVPAPGGGTAYANEDKQVIAE